MPEGVHDHGVILGSLTVPVLEQVKYILFVDTQIWSHVQVHSHLLHTNTLLVRQTIGYARNRSSRAHTRLSGAMP